MTRTESGSLGGRATVKKYGKAYMQHLARRGAMAFHNKYKLEPLGTSDFAIVYRDTGIPTGKTIRGLVLSARDF